MGGHHDRRGEVAHVRGDRNLADQLAEGEHRGTSQHPAHRGRPRLRRAIDDRVQLVDGRIADAELEEEAIQLRLRQRVRAFHLTRVLGRQDEERSRERPGTPSSRTWPPANSPVRTWLMTSRCPTITFSTSLRNASNAVTNAWTRESCWLIEASSRESSQPL